MKRSVLLSTFLFAAVLSPISLQGYNCAPPPTAKLSILELRVGSFSGENVIEGFNPNVFSYDVRFPESESVGVLWVKTNHPSTKVDVEYDGLPVQLVGQSVAELNVPLGSSELTLVVTRLGAAPDTNTYVVRILRDDDPIADLVDKIRTEVDPHFEYRYEQTKFVPPPGKTLLIVGQTLEDISEYTADFPHEPAPGGWMAYWGIHSTEGLWETAVREGYSQNHQELVDRFPNTVLQSGLWMAGYQDRDQNNECTFPDCCTFPECTVDGRYDHVIRGFSTWAKTIDRPIYLRIGYEFDGVHNRLDPVEYVDAYQHFVDITREEGVTNVAFVWHSYAAPPYEGYPLESWYPGDEYVDWVAVSLFGHMYIPDPGPYGNAVFDFARLHKKPVMVAESSPVYGILDGDLDSWNTWFVNYFSLAYQKNIKAISFINADWTQVSLVPPDWQDARLQNNATVAEAWFMETAKDRYLKQSPQLFEQLGFVR